MKKTLEFILNETTVSGCAVAVDLVFDELDYGTIIDEEALYILNHIQKVAYRLGESV